MSIIEFGKQHFVSGAVSVVPSLNNDQKYYDNNIN